MDGFSPPAEEDEEHVTSRHLEIPPSTMLQTIPSLENKQSPSTTADGAVVEQPRQEVTVVIVDHAQHGAAAIAGTTVLPVFTALETFPTEAINPTAADSPLPATRPEVGQPIEQPQLPGPPKILFLDGLRGLAALLVILQHSFYMQPLAVGMVGVDIFFVLSAFLLTMLFERKASKLLQQRAGVQSWAMALVEYLIKRFLRVYPLFFVITCVLWSLSDDKKSQYFLIRDPEPKFDLYKVLTFEFPYRYHVFWTLPVEIGYYFVIPVFAVVFVVLGRFWWLPMGPLMVLIVYQNCYVNRRDHMGLGPHIASFLAGSCAAVVFARSQQAFDKHERATGKPLRKWLVGGLRLIELVALAVLLSSCFRGMFFTWLHIPAIHLVGVFSFVSVPLSTMLVIELLSPWVLTDILEWSLLRFCGKISFSLYLVHSFVIYSDFIQNQTYYDGIAARLGLCCLLASVSYYLVERPCQRLAGHASKWLASWDHLSSGTTASSDTTSQSSSCWCSWLPIGWRAGNYTSVKH